MQHKLLKRIISCVICASMTLSSVAPSTSIVLADDNVGVATVTDADNVDDESTPIVDDKTTEETVVADSTEEVAPTSEDISTEETTSEETTEVTEEEKEEETTEEENVEEPYYVEFDHIYNDVDVSVISTSDLFVQTSNPSVFTKNTNVVSNYEDVYVISCNSVEEAQSVYSYYVDKVEFITDLSNTVTLSDEEEPTEESTEEPVQAEDDKADLSDVNTTSDDAIANLSEIATTDYSGYIALIDSGANADANLDVTGTGTGDSTGHGTRMYNYIKYENPNAKVLSIKAFNGNTTDVASIYAAIKLAIENKVSVINMSFVAGNVEKNTIIKDIINEAIANGITVIGAAGNYSLGAKNFIPGCIDNVITVGAVNEDGTLYETSNYDADLYVVATSTSEATARYSGIYTSGKDSDKVFTEFTTTTNDYGNKAFSVEQMAQISVAGDYFPDSNNVWVQVHSSSTNGTGTFANVISCAVTASDSISSSYFINASESDFTNNKTEIKSLFDNGYLVDKSGSEFDYGTGGSTSTGSIKTVWANCINHSLGVPKSTINTLGDNGDGSLHLGTCKIYEEVSNHKATALYAGCVSMIGVQSFVFIYKVQKELPWHRKITVEKVDVNTGNAVVGANLQVRTSKTATSGTTMTDNGDGTYTWTQKNLNGGSNSKIYIYEVKGGKSKDGTISYDNAQNNNKWLKSNGTLTSSSDSASSFTPAWWWDDEFEPADTNPDVLAVVAKQYPQYFRTVQVNKRDKETGSLISNCTLTVYSDLAGTNSLGNMTMASAGVYRWKSSLVSNTTTYATVYIKETSGGGDYNNDKNNGKWLGADGKFYTTPQGWSTKLHKDGDTATYNTPTVDNDQQLYFWLTCHKQIVNNSTVSPAGATYGLYTTNPDTTTNATNIHTFSIGANGNATDSFDVEQYMQKDSSGHYVDTTFYLKEINKPTNTECVLNEKAQPVVVSRTSHSPNVTNATLKTVKDNVKVYAKIVKKVDTTKYPCVVNNPNYSIQGTTFKVFKSLQLAQQAINNNNYNNAIGTITINSNISSTNNQIESSLWEVPSSQMNKDNTGLYTDTTFYVVESQQGKGYIKDENIYDITVTPSNIRTNAKSITITNIPMTDPSSIVLYKLKDNILTSLDFGDAKVDGVQYTLTQYYTQANMTAGTNAVKSVVYKSKNNTTGTKIAIDDISSIVSGTPWISPNTNNPTLPIGWYTLKETKVSDAKGYKFSLHNYYISVLETDDDEITVTVYKDDLSTIVGKDVQNHSQDGIVSHNNIKNVVNGDIVLTTKEDAEHEPLYHGSIVIKKVNAETNSSTQDGINSLEGIRFAIVNVSDNAVQYPAPLSTDEQTINPTYAKNTIIDIVTMDKNGNANKTVSPVQYGTYEIHELRKDATWVVGDTWNDTSAKNGTSIYANTYYTWCDNVKTKMINKENPTYTVDVDTLTVHVDGQTYNHQNGDAPIRSDAQWTKVDIDGEPMAYIPFLVSLVQRDDLGNETIVEQHVIMSDANGIVNTKTRGNKSATTVNKLDQYLQNGKYVGPFTNTEANTNIWFGNINNYPDKSVVNNSRGSFLYGYYKVEEIPCEKNAGQTMLKSDFTITEDHKVVTLKNIFVDLNIIVTSDALDVSSDSNQLTLSTTTTIKDDLYLVHLKVGEKYRVITEAFNVKKDGTKVSLGQSEPYDFTATKTDNTNTSYMDVTNTFNVDTSMCEEGTTVHLVDYIYQWLPDENTWSADPVVTHNTECNNERQTLYLPEITTQANNSITNNRIGSIEPVSNLVDEVTFTNLGDKTYYLMKIDLLDNATGNVLKDVDGKDCTLTLNYYAHNTQTSISKRNGVVIGPTSGTFSFNSLEIEPFKVLIEDGKSATFRVSLLNENEEVVLVDNKDYTDEAETIREIKIQTTAGSVKEVASGKISKQGLIPNDTQAILRDIITYENVAETVQATIKGKVVLKDDPTTVVAEETKTVTLDKTIGTTNTTYIDFTFDSTPYAKKKLVVFEEVYLNVNGTEVLIEDHKDINDANQMVRVPDIQTTLNSEVKHNNYKVTKNSGHIDLIDYVTYTNVKPGETYTVTCVLYDKITGEEVYDINGNLVSVTLEKVAEDENGVWEMPISFDSVPRDIHWETDDGYVAFEELKGDDEVTYAVHNDIKDKGQTVYNPKFKTKAINLSETKYILAAPNQKITDIVTLRNFDKANEEGDTFTLKIRAVDAETGNVLKDADGNDYTNTKTFVWNGQTEEPIDITIDATNLAGKTIVFYENLYYGNSTEDDDELLREETQDSHLQSVYVPEIHTTAVDVDTNTKLLALNKKIKDVVSVNNILPDTDYTFITKLWDKNEGRFITNADGTEYSITTDYHSPSNGIDEDAWTNKNYSVNDEVEIIMDVANTEKLNGKDIVVFEYMYYGKDNTTDDYSDHTNPDDENQTIQVPDGFTTALGEQTVDHLVKAEKDIKFTDTITYKNLIPNIEYKAIATLMVYDSQEEVAEGQLPKYETLKDSKGNVITQEVEFTPTEKNGTVDVPFTIDTTNLKGKTIVVFEDMYYNNGTEDVEIFEHKDITDEEQSIHVPDGKTTALGDKTKEHIVYADKDITINDTVTYTNLVPNKKYTAVGTLYKKVVKEDGTVEAQPLLDANNKPITNSVEFTANKPNGEVVVPFTINTTYLKGEKIVVFEDVLYKGDVSIFTHADINDKGQTVNVPKGHTTAKDSKTNKHLAPANAETTIIDTIYYENLIPGLEYEATGTLYSAKSGKPYEVNGQTFTNTVKFTPTEENGTIDVPITMNTTNLEGSTIVVFEDVTYNKEIVFIHHELTDEEQSVHITKVGTKATDKVDNDNVIDGTSTEQTIVDTVKYENLIPNKEYTIKGKLVIKPTDEEKKDPNYKVQYVTDENNKPIEVSKTFKPETANGEVKVEFTIDASKYAGKKLVAFESIEFEGVEIGTHMDIDDEEQTITVSLLLHVQIAKADKDNIKYFLKGAEITIFNEDGTIAKDIDGNDCVGVTDENGEVNFTVLYKENNTYYAQETKAPSGYNINNDKFEITPSNDRESAGTDLIKISILDTSIVIPPKTNDMIPIMIIFIIAIGGITGIVVFRKRREH